jgi:hypothetical protein
MPTLNLSGMTVEALMDLRKRVDEMLLERRSLFEPIVWNRSVWHECHGLMPEVLSVLR